MTYPSLGDDVGHHPPKGEALTKGVWLTGAATPAIAALQLAGRLRAAEAPTGGAEVTGPRTDGDRVPRAPLPRRELDFVNRFIPDSEIWVWIWVKDCCGEEISWGC